MLGNAVSTALPFCFVWEVLSVFFHTLTFTRQQYFKTDRKNILPLWKIPTNFVLLWSRRTTLCLNL